MVLLLARDELEGDLRHALAQRGDERDVGEEVERDELFNTKERTKWRRNNGVCARCVRRTPKQAARREVGVASWWCIAMAR